MSELPRHDGRDNATGDTGRSVPAGVATGIGSLPGTDPRAAAELTMGELPDFPHLPELPGRGAGADLIGRGAGILVDLPVELHTFGWRFTDAAGRDLRLARELLDRDLDALTDAADGYAGPMKVQVAGPWTLAAGIELRRGERAVRDAGACRDIAQSLVEGLRRHVADVRRRLPAADIVVQLDEPSLPAVLAGRLETASKLGTLRPVAAADVEATLAGVLTATGDPAIVHCCAEDVPLEILRRAGARGVALDAALLSDADTDALGAAVEAGLVLILGVVPGSDAQLPADGLPTVDHIVAAVRSRLRRIGFDAERTARTVSLSPTCGLAGASPEHARRTLVLLREAARALSEHR